MPTNSLLRVTWRSCWGKKKSSLKMYHTCSVQAACQTTLTWKKVSSKELGNNFYGLFWELWYSSKVFLSLCCGLFFFRLPWEKEKPNGNGWWIIIFRVVSYRIKYHTFMTLSDAQKISVHIQQQRKHLSIILLFRGPRTRRFRSPQHQGRPSRRPAAIIKATEVSVCWIAKAKGRL